MDSAPEIPILDISALAGDDSAAICYIGGPPVLFSGPRRAS